MIVEIIGGTMIGGGFVAGGLVGGGWLVGGTLVGGWFVGGALVGGTAVGNGLDGEEVRVACSLGRFVAVGGIDVAEGMLVAVRDATAVGEAVAVNVCVNDGTVVTVTVFVCVGVVSSIPKGSAVDVSCTSVVGVADPPVLGIIKSGS
jgi:hypothetical protein